MRPHYTADVSSARPSSPGSPVSLSIAVAVLMIALAPAPWADAQMPGVPVLQNAFAAPGFTVAANYAEGGGTLAFGGAVAWGIRGGRFQLTGGVGAVNPPAGATSASYGGRASASLLQFAGGAAGVAAFAGVGGAQRGDTAVISVPAGAAIGFRWAFGERGMSAYATPSYRWERNTRGDESSTRDGFLRLALGLDVTIVSRLGATLGYEFGQRAEDDAPGPAGRVWGIGISYAFR